LPFVIVPLKAFDRGWSCCGSLLASWIETDIWNWTSN
jgi:hypothetical protein